MNSYSFCMNDRVVHVRELTGKFAEIEKGWVDQVKLTLARLQANEDAYSKSVDDDDRIHDLHEELGVMFSQIACLWLFTRSGYDVSFPEIVALASAASSGLMASTISMYRDDHTKPDGSRN